MSKEIKDRYSNILRNQVINYAGDREFITEDEALELLDEVESAINYCRAVFTLRSAKEPLNIQGLRELIDGIDEK